MESTSSVDEQVRAYSTTRPMESPMTTDPITTRPLRRRRHIPLPLESECD